MSWKAGALVCDWCECRFVPDDIAIPAAVVNSSGTLGTARHYHLGCLIRGEERKTDD